MVKSSLHIEKALIYHLFLYFSLLTTYAECLAQPHPLPVLPDTSKLGQFTSRTMNLLHFSSPDKRNEVRILVYGQSISEQEWWLEVKRAVQERFPYAHIIMENKAIGGFSTQYLFKTVEMDVSSFYPDLVLLHIYGNNKDYESVINTIRSRTTAEVAIMTDHYIGENRWSDTMSCHILPALAGKYKCDIINIRDPWKAYLKDNNLETSALLKDGTHLNDYGNFLMAELVKPLFCYKSFYADDPFGLVKNFYTGPDLFFNRDTMSLHFTGNRADMMYVAAGAQGRDSVKIILDGRPPSSFQGCYYITRPYNERGDAWPWDLPAMIRVNHSSPWVAEEWTCLYTQAKAPYLDVRFRISGSVTGQDGSGSVNRDFVSRSGRVIINKGDAENGGDWHLNRSYRVLKTEVKSGDSFRWKTYAIGKDIFAPGFSNNDREGQKVILFQGVSNSGHDLKIVALGRNIPSITMIRVYRPYWNR